jgi:predicted ATPase/class 3 adenylate cyclase
MTHRTEADDALPTGTVVFLRTDIVGSMDLERALGERFDELAEVHRTIVSGAVASHGGRVVRTEGDAFFAVFRQARPAADAAVSVQRGMAVGPWPTGNPFRLRIGIHAGAAHLAGDDYGGFEVGRAARVASVGWGGQIVLSDPARALIVGSLPEDWTIRDLGSHRLKGIPTPERLFGLEVAGLSGDFPPLRDASGPTGWLPERLTSFLGREAELERLATFLSDARLLTLTGPGGTGKTSLAVELARTHAAEFEDGAWFVDLQAVHDPTAVQGEIAHALGLLDGPLGPAADRLMAFVHDRQLLIVIDNFEQVLAASEVLVDLLRSSTRTRIIVTSRVPLRLSAEQEVPVQPLSLDAGEDRSEAVRLFVQRARQVRPEIVLGEDDQAAVEGICRLVDGLPLAIELCAARVAALPLTTLRDRLATRLPLPGSAPRDLPERQRTIEATVAWSHALLDAPTQRLFARLSAFEESFDVDQAGPVCGPRDELGAEVLDGLIVLREQSLIGRVDDPMGGFRFRMLETIRAVAGQHLRAIDEAQRLRQRHMEAFAALAEEASTHLPGSDQARWIDRLEADGPNLRAAVEHAIADGATDIALRLVGSLWRYWLMTGRLSEGRASTDRALTLPGADLTSAARAKALHAAGGLAYWMGDAAGADAIYQEALVVAKEVGGDAAIARAQFDLAFTRRLVGDVDGSDRAMADARERFERVGDAFSVLRIDWASSLIFSEDADPATRLRMLTAMVERLEAQGDPWSSGTALHLRSRLLLASGRPVEALRLSLEAFRLALAARDRAEVVLALQPLAGELLGVGEHELAAIVIGAVQGAGERFGIRAPVSFERLSGVPDPMPALIDRLGADGCARAIETGRRMTLDDAVDLAAERLARAQNGHSIMAESTAIESAMDGSASV